MDSSSSCPHFHPIGGGEVTLTVVALELGLHWHSFALASVIHWNWSNGVGAVTLA